MSFSIFLKFFNNLFNILLKNRWLKKNGYIIFDQGDNNYILLEIKGEEYKLDKKETV